MKRFGLVLALLAVVFIAAPAVAQEQTGSLVGKIATESGETLPGVSVEIKGPSGTLVAVTDARGEYRFPRVTPGAYKVTARLQGFQTYEASRINVSLGDKATVNVTLKISSVMETVVVTGDRVQIAVGENATSTAIAAEQIALLPKGRDFTSIVAQAPGASNEAFSGGIQIDGASGSENRFVIDGVDTTQPQDGLSGQNMITEFIEEVQVKTAGYAAEYGGALGGVINAVTKSGTNEFHGFVGVNYTDSSLNGDARPVYGQSYPGYYIQPNKDDQTRWEPGFSLGGPVLKDKLWFFVGYNPTLVSTTRSPLNTTSTFDQDQTFHYFSGNLKGNLGSKFVYKLSANISPSDRTNSLPNVDGSTPATADLTVDAEFPVSSYSFYADYVPSSNFYITGRAGMYSQDTEVTGIDSLALYTFQSGVIPVPTTDPLYKPTGYNSTPTFTSTDHDTWDRTSAGLDMNFFVSALGSHSLKAGFAYELIENDVDTGQNGNQYRIRWNTAYLGQKGTAGSVEVRRFRTDGGADSTNIGLYIQDTWNIHPNFTLNLGVRTEQERIPNYGYAVDPTLPQYAIEFDFQDKLAPRLGFAWDITGKQQLKLYGSYGTYYDITKLEMPRGSYGADKWVSHVYALNTTNWPSLAVGCAIVDNTMTQANPCPHLGNEVVRNFRAPSDPTSGIDPDLKPMENREFQLGLDYQLTKNSVVSARYVNKTLINTIEDIGYLVTYADGTTGEQYITGNPGKGVVAGDPDGAGPIPVQGEAVRDYEAIELTYNRRFADNFSLRASYVYSKLSGNYSGLASTDEFGRTDPNVARYFDGLAYSYDSHLNFVDGVLNTDRPHSFEFQGLYRAPWGTNFGLNFIYQSGAPRTTLATYAQVEFYPNGRNDIGRLSSWNQTDLLIAHPFKIGDFNLEVSLNVLNLFDQEEVFQTGTYQYFEDICDVDAHCDYSNAYYFNELVPYKYDEFMKANGASPNPQYGKPIAWQNPRVVRLGVKFLF